MKFLKSILSFVMASCMVIAFSCKRENVSKRQAENTNENNAQVNNSMIEKEDADFIAAASVICKEGIEISRLGEVKAIDSQLRDFCSEVAIFYKEIGLKLNLLAERKRMVFAVNREDDKGWLVTTLRNKKGREFDREYLRLTLNQLKKWERLFEEASTRTTDAEIRAITNEILPEIGNQIVSAEAVLQRVESYGKVG